MASQNASNIVTPGSSINSVPAAITTNNCPSQVPFDHCRNFSGPVGILWDIENCPVPNDVRPEDVAGNIRMALRIHPVIKGAVTMFSAYGDFNIFPRRLREGCQRTGVKLVDVPNGRKDAADKAILVDMFLFALDNRPPSSILLISGDVDFAPALHILGQRGYTIILVIPDKVGVSSALSNAGRFVWDWPSVARGEGFVPPKSIMSRGSDLAGFFAGCHVGDNIDDLIEEEAIIYTGGRRNPIYREITNQTDVLNSTSVCQEASKGICPVTEWNGRNMNAASLSPQRSQCLPSESPYVNQSQVQDDVSWVQPGDIQGLKGQLVRLLEMSGGSLPLVRLPSEYLKNYGRPLYVAEYGAHKLVNLIKKVGGSFVVEGKGHNKVLYLRNPGCRYDNAGACLTKKDVKGKVNMDDGANVGVCHIMGSSSDDFSDDDKVDCVEVDGHVGAAGGSTAYSCGTHLETFKQEVQELLVCYSCRLLLSSFEALYQQRYKKPLNYRYYGVEKLEDLIAKVSDVAVLHEDKASKRRFLISGSFGG